MKKITITLSAALITILSGFIITDAAMAELTHQPRLISQIISIFQP